jgi:hypothetical protein
MPVFLMEVLREFRDLYFAARVLRVESSHRNRSCRLGIPPKLGWPIRVRHKVIRHPPYSHNLRLQEGQCQKQGRVPEKYNGLEASVSS